MATTDAEGSQHIPHGPLHVGFMSVMADWYRDHGVGGR